MQQCRAGAAAAAAGEGRRQRRCGKGARGRRLGGQRAVPRGAHAVSGVKGCMGLSTVLHSRCYDDFQPGLVARQLQGAVLFTLLRSSRCWELR